MGDERVRHLRKRLERGLLIALDGLVPGGRGRPVAREQPSTLEERTRERAADRPYVAGALDDVLELAALAPYSPVRPRRGKKFATATPTSAFAATTACSACWMSGRRSSSWDGRPTGTSGSGDSPSSGLRRTMSPGGRPNRIESWFSLATIWRSSSGMPARAWVSAALARDTSSSVPIPPA